VRYNGYRQPVVSIFEVKIPNGATELQKKGLIDKFFKDNIKQDGIIQRWPHEIIQK
jgi:hypothetical protein